MAEVDLQGEPIFIDVGKSPDSVEYNHEQTKKQSAVKTAVQGAAADHGKRSTNQETNATDNSCLMIQTRRIRCPECHRYTAETEEKMLRHIKKIHRGENPFQCYLCDYSTYNKSLFEEHVRIHQNIKPYKCSQCPYKSVSKKNLKKHELIHRPNNPLKCPKCDFIGRHLHSLKRHMNTHENDGKKVFSCVKCNFKCQNSMVFINHKKKKEKCDMCDFVACTGALLKKHAAKDHDVGRSNSIKELFICKLCKWSSNHKARILLHLIHHPNQPVDENVIDISILKKFDIMK